MLTLHRIIKDVPLLKFSVAGESVFVWRKTDDKCSITGYRSDKIAWKSELAGPFPDMLRMGKCVLIADDQLGVLKIDTEQGTTVNQLHGNFAPVLSTPDYVVLSTRINNFYCPGVYDNQLQLCWQSQEGIDFYLSNGIDLLIGFSLRANAENEYAEFSRYEAASPLERWTYSVRDFPAFIDPSTHCQTNVEVLRFLGTIDDDLWLALNNYKIATIDAGTGIHKSLIGNPFFSYPKLPNVFPSSHAMAIDSARKEIIGMFMHHYWTVDATTFEVTHFNLEELFRNENVRCGGDFVFDDACIYFSDVDHCKIVAFDRATKKIRWQHVLEIPNEGKSFAMEIQKHGDTLYVHDNRYNLHIFKIEN